MKTLSERFKPEVKELFQAESDRFPTILKMVMQELDSKYWVSDLTLGCVATIASISGLYTHLNTNYQGMYMHDTLNSMFEENKLNQELDNPGMFIDDKEWEKEMGR